MAHLAVTLLGRFEAHVDGERVTGFSYDKVRALLAYLVVESARPHRRETIAGLLWTDFPEARARQNLSQALLTLRRAIHDDDADPPFLDVSRYELQLNPNARTEVDVTAFSASLEACERHPHTTLAACDPCLNQLAEAMALYRGEFMATFSLPDSASFEEWALLERERLGRQAISVLSQLADSHLKRGEYEKALAYARRHVQLDPWHESAHRQVMQALTFMGRRHDALEQYERCRTALQADLGVTPEPQTQSLYEEIRTGELAPDTEAYTRVQHVRPIGPVITATADGQPASDSRLPLQLTPFIGREAELEMLCRAFCNDDIRLLSLVGPGGSGKTRLAIEAGQRCIRHFADGITLVPLAALQSEQALIPAIAGALGLQPRIDDVPLTRLKDYLSQREMLLILDNFEQVLNGLGAVLDLLTAAPALRVALTSRVRTNAQGECLFPVAGMAVPASGADLVTEGQKGGMALFTTGARRNQPGLRLTEENVPAVWRICSLVRGMPLAILLAASWVPLLSPIEIAERLESAFAGNTDFLRADWQDVPARQRSLRTVFDHAWELLTIRERAVFQALAIFRGGFTRQAAKNVVGATLWELRRLVDKSFVSQYEAGRYEVHELMRQYAGEKLAEMPVVYEEVRAQHSRHYLTDMTRWATALQGPEQKVTMEEIALEIENARLAWLWLLEHQNRADLVSPLQACCLFYEWRIRYEEGISLCRNVMDTTQAELHGAAYRHQLSAPQSRALQIHARAWLGRFEQLSGRRTAAESVLEEALALASTTPEDTPAILTGYAHTLERLGDIAAVHDRDVALDLYQSALLRYQEAGDVWGTANAYYDLAMVGHQTSHYEQSRQWYERSLELYRELGDQRGISEAMIWLGFSAVRQGDAEYGISLLKEGVEARRKAGDREGLGVATYNLGEALIWTGHFEESEEMIIEGLTICRDLGVRYHAAYASVYLACVQAFQGHYDEARRQLELGASLARAGNFLREVAFAQFIDAGVALAQHRFPEALELAQASMKLYREINQRDELSWAQGAAAAALHNLHRRDEAWIMIGHSLRTSVALKSFGVVLWGLPCIALLLCDEGEIRASIEIYRMVQTYPMIAGSLWHHDVMGFAIAAAAADASPDIVAEAETNAQARDLEATIAKAMTILESKLAQIDERAYAEI